MSTPAIAPHDLHRRRSGLAAPVASELHALLDDLGHEGVDPPAEAAHALELLADVVELHTPPNVTAWIGAADLERLEASQVMDYLRLALTDTGLATGAVGPNLVGQVRDALVARATAAVIADLDRIIDDLRPAFDATAAQVHIAAKTGITTATTAAQVIALGDDAVAAYRTLAQPLATLDRLHRLRNRLLFIAGRELADHDVESRRWVDDCIAAPVELTITDMTWERARLQRMAPGTLTASVDADTDGIDVECETLEEVTA